MNEVKSGRQSKTLSFDPPVVSFYNKRHPKLQNKKKIKVLVNSLETDKNRVSKIDLLLDEDK